MVLILVSGMRLMVLILVSGNEADGIDPSVWE